ncbi:LacI family DNA-binding transcriptional regulator [Treponema parvum]|uniref:LacI family DNA-binding transcriptional regulator n=1 Tax=Treponema parvum TaxID=138851 RepID=A0A975IEI5_9SPIR|nr:LacI family DNA-binding transcriptional regulator [Treponema parvum]QTQ13981.1 LacI family DNA-binding transcriptional regulator [Treponema parvum]
MEKKYFGIRDIARFANVSTATVSRVINNPETTSKQIRKKVEEVIKEYNYIPNQNIKKIFSKNYNLIAIFIHDIQNPFYTLLIRYINQVCIAHKYTLLICDTEDDSNREEDYLNYCLASRCTGIILTEGVNYSLFSDKSLSLPIVTLDRKIDKLFPCVTSNNIEATKNVVDYLYNLNHKKIAFIGCKETYISVQKRKEGYIEGLKEKKLAITPSYIYERNPGLNLENGKEALRYFLTLPDPPSAIICSNDLIALGVINEAHMLNLSIPADFSVVGFDDVIETIHYPRITTVKQDIIKIVQTLFEQVTSPLPNNNEIIIDTKLIQGYTTTRARKRYSY